MRKITPEELREILDKHRKWLRDEKGGERANLDDTDLRGASLVGASLVGASLDRASLDGASLNRASLVGASLNRASLNHASLVGASLDGASLDGASLNRASLVGASLVGASLDGASLDGASLVGASLNRASLVGASLDGANLPPELVTKFFPLCCPETGAFIGWKKCRRYIVKLKITDAAKRSSAFGRKCRCSEAVVLGIERLNGEPGNVTSISSNYDNTYIYTIGETVRVDNFDEDRTHECAPGIHFFITRQEAVDY